MPDATNHCKCALMAALDIEQDAYRAENLNILARCFGDGKTCDAKRSCFDAALDAARTLTEEDSKESTLKVFAEVCFDRGEVSRGLALLAEIRHGRPALLRYFVHYAARKNNHKLIAALVPECARYLQSAFAASLAMVQLHHSDAARIGRLILDSLEVEH